MVQLLLDLRDNIESDRVQEAEGRGLSETENSFYNILMEAISDQADVAEITESTDERVTELVRSLVVMIEEATAIVDFFDKQSEVSRVRRDIRRAVLDEPFGTTELVQRITDQFMRLAEVKFK